MIGWLIAISAAAIGAGWLFLFWLGAWMKRDVERRIRDERMR